IRDMKAPLVNCVVAKYICFEFVDKRTVFSNALNVFASESLAFFAVLQSTHHALWSRAYGSSLKMDTRYNPTDCFETFPFPSSYSNLEAIGERYRSCRRNTLLGRQEGLTKTYNRFHDSVETSADIQKLRQLHVEMDNAVAIAYGWTDLDFDHDFHETKQGT